MAVVFCDKEIHDAIPKYFMDQSNLHEDVSL